MTRTPTPTRTATATATGNPAGTATVCETYPSTGFVAVQDTWIDYDKPDTSNEAAPKLQVEPGDKEKQALLQFNLSSIPQGSTVESATLYLNVTKSSTYTVEFLEILSEWQEDVTWETQPDYDFFTIFGSLDLTAEQSGNCVRSLDLDVDLVQYWVDYPAENFGIMMVAAGGTERTDYSSRESGRPPRLVVTYTP
jgi:hypothetical protein